MDSDGLGVAGRPVAGVGVSVGGEVAKRKAGVVAKRKAGSIVDSRSQQGCFVA